MNNYAFIVTAEHASDTIPSECTELLEGFMGSLETHQIYDIGIKSVAQELAERMGCPLLLGEFTRLAVDLNRSIGNVSQFSKPIYEADESLKFDLLQKYYLPFREKAHDYISEQIQAGKTVVHLSLHSFVKRFFDIDREVDLGILFDDHRPAERQFGRNWIKALQTILSELNVTENQPYHGREDGHATALRRLYPEKKYLGIEIEFSQDLDLELDAANYAKILARTLAKIS